ncbi:thiamine pyrophosphokinase 1 [Petromyzon marinus]
MAREYRPLDCLLHTGSEKLGLLILNQPLDGPERLQLLWSKSLIRACADGGANALYKCMGNSRDRFIPDFISGDFDSIEKAVQEYYKEKGSYFIETPDQNHTDFTKALQLLLQRVRDHNTKIDMVVTLGGLSGRFDQILASVETLYQTRPLTNLPLYVIQGSSLICLLREGKSTIRVDKDLQGSWCGLIPVGEPCYHVTTSGLKWNLSDAQLKFGTLVSTSNKMDESGVVTVETDAPLVWTMEVPRLK